MSSIQDHLFDSEFLDLSLHYLSAILKLKVTLLDAQHQVLLEKGETSGTANRYYPFHFPRNIGGFSCTAADEQTLQAAEPHINYCLAAINSQLTRELELTELGDEMLQLSAQLTFLSKVAPKIIGVNDLESCYRITLEEIAATVKADQAFIHTRGRWNDELVITHRIDKNGILHQQADQCLQEHGNREHPIICATADGHSLLYAPIREKDSKVIGQMVFLRPPETRPFTAYEKKLVGIIENIISPNFETLRLYDSLQDLYLNTVKALAAAIDAKDEYTHGHSFRVAKYAVAIGRQLELPAKEISDLEIAAYMHDLGKIGISELILGKPGKLTNDEFCHIRQHPVFTDKILQPIHLASNIIQGAVQHHERLDGTGYPLGLAGDDISLFGRVIAVADVFDALTSKRPYREEMPVETALKMLCDNVNKEFDRNVVLALIRALQHDMPNGELNEVGEILKFDALQNLNQFLLELSDFVVSAPPRHG